jgi:hypothetical protein
MSNTLTVTEVVNSVTVTPVNNTVNVATTGLQGPKGDTGATGATGAQGSSGVVTVNAPITNAGTSTAADLSISTGTTSAVGVLQLTDSTSSTSTTTAATANSVKSAYDFANSQHALLDPISGSYYRTPVGNSVATGTNAASANITYYTAIQFSKAVTLDRIAINTTFTGFSGTASVRLGIFANTNGKPGALILDAGTVAPITNAASYAITINQSLDAGVYWFANNSITAATVNAYYSITNANTNNITLFGGALGTATSNSGVAGFQETYTATTAFANAGTLTRAFFAPITYVRVV